MEINFCAIIECAYQIRGNAMEEMTVVITVMSFLILAKVWYSKLFHNLFYNKTRKNINRDIFLILSSSSSYQKDRRQVMWV